LVSAAVAARRRGRPARRVGHNLLQGYDAVLAADIGGTNMRTGPLGLGLAETPGPSSPRVVVTECWCHADEDADRDQSIRRLADMLRTLALRADKERLRLAPFVGVGCPGVIQADGTIERGAQNLPGGGWEGKKFNLPACLAQMLHAASGFRATVILHNDAVVQGLSEAPEMQDVERWGVLTIGTGLGNARFTNQPSATKI
jgi:hypothetical protein